MTSRNVRFLKRVPVVATNLLLLGFVAFTAESEIGSPAPGYNLTAERAFLGYRGTCGRDPEVGLGVRVIEVFEGEPAQHSGLLVGDFIFKINGESIDFSDDLEMVFHMGEYRAGEDLRLDVKRGKSREIITFTPGKSPQSALDKLEEWIQIAEQRIGEGLPLYCDEDEGHREELVRSQRWAFFRNAIVGREVVLTIKRVAPGDSGIEVEVDPDLDLSFGDLTLDDLYPSFYRSIPKGLRQGESFQLRVSADSDGRTMKIETVEALPEHLRRLIPKNALMTPENL